MMANSLALGGQKTLNSSFWNRQRLGQCRRPGTEL